jgi:hypothetical protein
LENEKKYENLLTKGSFFLDFRQRVSSLTNLKAGMKKKRDENLITIQLRKKNMNHKNSFYISAKKYHHYYFLSSFPCKGKI